jgi:hypothetical protein
VGALFRIGVRRGLLGGSKPWQYVAAIGLVLRLLKKMGGREEKVVFTEELKPGESLVVTHLTRD